MHVRRGQLCWGEEHHCQPVCWKASVAVGPQRSQDQAAEQPLPYNGIFHFSTKGIFARKKNNKNRLLASFYFIFFDRKHLVTPPGSGNFHSHLHTLPLDRGVCSCNKTGWITLVLRHRCPQNGFQLAAELCTCAIAFLPLPHRSYCHCYGAHYPVCNSKTEL